MAVIYGLIGAPIVGFVATVQVLTVIDAPATRPPPGVQHVPMTTSEGLLLAGLVIGMTAPLTAPLWMLAFRVRRGRPQLVADLEGLRFTSGHFVSWSLVGYVTDLTGLTQPSFEVVYTTRSSWPRFYQRSRVYGDDPETLWAQRTELFERWKLLGDTSDPARYLQKSAGNRGG
jgi:hypothetical protein